MTTETQVKRSEPNACAVVILAIIGLAIAGAVISAVVGQVNTAIQGTPTPPPTSTPQHSAWTACTSFVQTKYGISMFDSERYDPAAVETMDSATYYVKIFYAKHGQYFECLIGHKPNGDWVALHVAPVQ